MLKGHYLPHYLKDTTWLYALLGHRCVHIKWFSAVNWITQSIDKVHGCTIFQKPVNWWPSI